MNISALHNESFQSIDVIQKQIKDPDISYWFDQVYNNYKPHKDEIPECEERNHYSSGEV